MGGAYLRSDCVAPVGPWTIRVVDDGKEFRQVLNSDALLTVCKRIKDSRQ